MAKTIKKNVRDRSKAPLVSVVMSVYNGEKYIREAIDSIINQIYTDFEFIIINDGSTDDTLKIIKSYKDPRIVLISRENKGLVASLNEGIEKARGKYIARMDADDVSLPQRLLKQVGYMQGNPDSVICGVTFSEIDSHGKILQNIAVPLKDCVIRQELLARCPFAHGSTLFMRKACLDAGLYRVKDFPAEDYALWIRMAELGKMSNLRNNLFYYRVLDSSISRDKTELQNQQTNRLREVAWTKWPLNLMQQLKIWQAICDQSSPSEYLKLHYSLLKESAVATRRPVGFKLKLCNYLGRLYVHMNTWVKSHG